MSFEKACTAVLEDGIPLLSGECLLINNDGCELRVEPTDDANSVSKLARKGQICLTTHRIIFRSKDAAGELQSLCMPISSLRGVDVEQPIFGANYISGTVTANGESGLKTDASFRVWFNSGGAIDFGNTLLEAAQRAMMMAKICQPTYADCVANAPPPYPGITAPTQTQSLDESVTSTEPTECFNCEQPEDHTVEPKPSSVC